MYYIEEKYGNDGYATWLKILRQLAITEYHYLNLSLEADMMFLSAKCKLTNEKLIAIIEDLCALGEINKDLWKKYKIVFNEKFVENIADAYKRRSNKCIDLQGIYHLLKGLGAIPKEDGPLAPIVEASTTATQSSLTNTAQKNVTDLTDYYFQQLQNTDFIKKLSERASTTPENVRQKIPDFIKNKANVEYQNANECKNHFKNWVLQEFKKSSQETTITAKPISFKVR